MIDEIWQKHATNVEPGDEGSAVFFYEQFCAAVAAIKSNPALLWPEGEPFDYKVMRKQLQVELEATENYRAEITRLRGELEEKYELISAYRKLPDYTLLKGYVADLMSIREGLGAAIAYIKECDMEDHPDPGALEDCKRIAFEIYERTQRYGKLAGGFMAEVQKLQSELDKAKERLKQLEQLDKFLSKI